MHKSGSAYNSALLTLLFCKLNYLPFKEKSQKGDRKSFGKVF